MSLVQPDMNRPLSDAMVILWLEIVGRETER